MIWFTFQKLWAYCKNSSESASTWTEPSLRCRQIPRCK